MAPVYHGQWAFNGYTLYITTSSGETHPRATYAELEDIFIAPIGYRTNIPDYQDHWYEAQILHYGLAPTKNKAVAKMRLMDAFQDGTLEIPMEILRIEATLRKNWIKQDLDSHLQGPAIQPSPALAPAIAETMEIDTTDADATQKPEGGEEGNVFGAGLAGGAGMQGNMRSQQDKMQPPHAHPKRKNSNNSELSIRPLKTARYRGETGGSDLQVQIDDNTAGETFLQGSTITPVSVGNSCGRPGPDRELLPIEYQTVPLSHQTTDGMVSMSFPAQETSISDQNTKGTQLLPPGLMGADGASDHCDYGYNPATNSKQPSLVVGWSFKNRDSLAKA
ncbi:hypothetical protein N7537_006659 [Penicillium hordei]|uniref:Uncharacterized protein n=1 Tax=Penicillium hordei TaxID=40994 RepID=A0AAD6E809_9EURO|nr:uncharacterized protein N7537_006659 [Penicillium hordei]KAJ5603703.1 hypothetical protein N7537_006659 [Penicillium hordei]